MLAPLSCELAENIPADERAVAVTDRRTVERSRPDEASIDHTASSTHVTRAGAGSPCASSQDTTGLRSTPMRSISASTTSPGLR